MVEGVVLLRFDVGGSGLASLGGVYFLDFVVVVGFTWRLVSMIGWGEGLGFVITGWVEKYGV